MLFEVGADSEFIEIAPSMETQYTQSFEEVNLATGKGVGDSGATKPVMGLEEWPNWRKKLTDMGMADQITTERCQKTFRFGNDATATAKQRVTLPVWIRGSKREITVYLVPGRVSLLVARPCLEEWGIVVDYRNKKAMYLDEEPQTWNDIETNDKGHMILDLLNFPEDALEAKEE